MRGKKIVFLVLIWSGYIFSLEQNHESETKGNKLSQKEGQSRIEISEPSLSTKDEDSWSLVTNPLYLLGGYTNFQMDRRVGKKSVLGVNYAQFYADSIFFQTRVRSIGLKYQHHFFGEAMDNSMYTSLSATYYQADNSILYGVGRYRDNGVIPGFAIGYQWKIEPVLIKLGASLDIVSPYLDFQLGFAF